MWADKHSQAVLTLFLSLPSSATLTAHCTYLGFRIVSIHRRIFQCYFFLSLQNILYELETLPGEKRQFRCDGCKRSFSRQFDLKRHQHIHSREQQFGCDVCNKSFSRQRGLKRHQRIHGGQRSFCCDVCNKSFSQQRDLERHQSRHSGQRPFFCDVCNKSYKHQSNLKTHQRIHGGGTS
jgi:KRAB domain-containing zinc finger protein